MREGEGVTEIDSEREEEFEEEDPEERICGIPLESRFGHLQRGGDVGVERGNGERKRAADVGGAGAGEVEERYGFGVEVGAWGREGDEVEIIGGGGLWGIGGAGMSRGVWIVSGLRCV